MDEAVQFPEPLTRRRVQEPGVAPIDGGVTGEAGGPGCPLAPEGLLPRVDPIPYSGRGLGAQRIPRTSAPCRRERGNATDDQNQGEHRDCAETPHVVAGLNGESQRDRPRRTIWLFRVVPSCLHVIDRRMTRSQEGVDIHRVVSRKLAGFRIVGPGEF